MPEVTGLIFDCRRRHFDSPSIHGISCKEYLLREELMAFAIKHDVVILAMPHNTSQAIQPQVSDWRCLLLASIPG